jgi:hypothetical protein
VCQILVAKQTVREICTSIKAHSECAEQSVTGFALPFISCAEMSDTGYKDAVIFSFKSTSVPFC